MHTPCSGGRGDGIFNGGHRNVMELIKIFWAFNFFIFTLLLLFVWSKIYIISKKLQSAVSVVSDMGELTAQLDDHNPAQGTPAGKTNQS